MFQIKSVIAEKPAAVISSASVLLGAIFLLHTAILWWPAKPEVQNSINPNKRALEFDVERIVSSTVFSSTQPSISNNDRSKKATATLVSQSDFSLQAVFESSDESRSTVIIAKSGHPPRSYGLGDILADGISISGIERDRVHLSNNGQSMVLTFKRQSRMPGGVLQRAADKILGDMSDEGKLGQVKQRLEQLRRQSQEQ
ncbi:MAG: type II secretion system protein N [Pseudomonadota bacterium]